jgi:hypothetical protein
MDIVTNQSFYLSPDIAAVEFATEKANEIATD